MTVALKLAGFLEDEASIVDMGRPAQPKSTGRRAAAELRRLQAEVDRLRAELQDIADYPELDALELKRMARMALIALVTRS